MSEPDVFSWSSTLKIIACVFHSVAIACTVLRLLYRWRMARFWWEDGWAAFALTIDVLCFVSACLQAPVTAQGMTPPIDRITGWITAVGSPSVIWPCWISILLSIVRVTHPSQKLRRVAVLVGCLFIVMWTAMMIQRIRICQETCVMGDPVALSQLIMNVMASIVLFSLHIWFSRQTKVDPRRRIMLFSVFFIMSLLISVVTIFHSVVLLTTHSDGIIFLSHIRTALSLMVCNLFVTVSFICRVWHRGRAGDLDATDAVTFTTVDLNTYFTENASADKQTVAPNNEELDSEGFLSTS